MRKGLLGHLEEYLEGFFGRKAEPPKPEETAEPIPVGPELDQSLGALHSLAVEMAARLKMQEPSHLGVSQDPAEVLAAATRIHAEIAEDVMAMHARLETGLTREQLESYQADMTPLLPYLQKEQGGVVERLYYFVLKRILLETATLAWEELMTRMQAHALRWPEPGGISPKATPEEREAARVRSLEESHHNFLQAKPEHVCDRVFGLVRIWRASYPPRGSDLWLQQCLLAVASGRQLQIFQRAVQLLNAPEGDEVKTRLRELGRENLEQTRQVLSSGTSSLSDVTQVLVSTDRLCSDLGPDLVWDWLKPRMGLTPVSA